VATYVLYLSLRPISFFLSLSLCNWHHDRLNNYLLSFVLRISYNLSHNIEYELQNSFRTFMISFEHEINLYILLIFSLTSWQLRPILPTFSKQLFSKQIFYSTSIAVVALAKIGLLKLKPGVHPSKLFFLHFFSFRR